MQAALELLERERPDRVVTLGGECSVSVAPFTYLARRYADDMAVVWIDAHPDITLPGDAYAGFHAMALTACMGRGDARIVSALPAHIDPSRVLLVGVRDWERPEIEARRRQYGIRHLTPTDVAADSGAVREWLHSCGASRVAVHFDMDVLDPAEIVAAVGVVPGGMKTAEVVRVIGDIAATKEPGGPDRRRADAPHGRPHPQHAARTSVAAVIRDRCGHDEAAAGEFPPAAASYRLRRSLRLGEIFVEQRNGLQTPVELLQSETLVRRVDRVLGQSEAQKQRLDAQNRLETADDRNGPARVEGQGLPARKSPRRPSRPPCRPACRSERRKAFRRAAPSR